MTKRRAGGPLYHESMKIATLTLASARLSRLITTDDLGQWLVKEPIDRLMDDYEQTHTEEPWWWKYRSGLDCPWCIGYWAALGLTVADMALPQRGAARFAFQAVTTSLAVNYVAATINAQEKS